MNKDLQTSIESLTQAVEYLRTELEHSKQLATLLQAREKRYRAIFDYTAIGLAQLAPNGRFLEVNRPFCDILGYDREELLHMTYLDVTHPDDREADKTLRQRILAGKIPTATWEKRYVRKDGTIVWVNMNLSSTTSHSEGRFLLAAIENINERRTLQESLGRIVTDLAKTEAVSLSGTWNWNIETDEISASDEACHLFQVDPHLIPVSRETFLSKVHPDDRGAVARALQASADEQKPYRVEYRIALPDGTQRLLSASGEFYRRNAHEPARVMIGMVQDITQRKQAEHALRESEQRFRQLFENAVDGIFLLSLNGRCSDVNRSACAMLGYGREELIGKRISQLLPKRDRERLLKTRDDLLRNISHIRLSEWELKRKDGTSVPVEVNAGILPDGRWVAMVRDITERRHTQKALERYAEEVRDLYDNAPCGYHSLDRDSLVVQMNRTELNWLGYTAEEVIGKKKMIDLLEQESQKKFLEIFPQFMKTGNMRDLELELVRKDGSILPVLLNASAVTDEQGSYLFSRTTLFDITELAAAQKKLRQAAAVFEHTHDAIIITDAGGTIVAVNKAFTNITGYTPEEVIGKNPRLLQSERQDDGFYLNLWQSLEQTGHWQGEIWDRKKSGELFPAWESVTAVKDVSGKVTEYISVFSDITTIKETEAKLLNLAYHDPLTGLPNRLLFNDRMVQAIAHAKRHRTHVALLLLDLDRFKLINDTLGHVAGDKLLQVIAARLKEAVREEDTVARLGGDEFAIILAQPPDITAAAMLAEKLVVLVSRPVSILGRTHTVSTSIGIAIYPDHAEDAETLVKCADIAMYGAKDKGKNGYDFYTQEMTRSATEVLMIDHGLRSAIVLNELELLYQPQIDLKHRRIVGAEALIRWNSSVHGLQMPGRFVPIAEQTDLIESIGEWVLEAACTQLEHWRSSGLPPLRLAINLSPRQLRRPQFIHEVRRSIERVRPSDDFSLEVEITETTLQTEPRVAEALKELKSLGLKIAVDDFGTGYSSLSSLKRLPVDILKIDRSFIDGIPDDMDDKALTSAIIAMGHSLGMRVIAEGIETREQLQFILDQQCDEAQGYLFYPPLTAKEFERNLQSPFIPAAFNAHQAGYA